MEESMKDFVKVHMKGEWPWVRRISENGDELIGRVDNHLVCGDLHGYKFNDVVQFKRIDGVWEAQKKIRLRPVAEVPNA